MKTEHEILTGVLAAQEDPDAADALIRQYMPFIKVQAAKVTHRIPHEEDDAMSIAMFAFHEAVMRYEKSRGAFLKYAAMAIRSRLIDYQRREKKHSGLISLDMPSGEEDDRSLAETLDSGKDEIGEMETRSAAKTEIMEFAAELGRYGLSLSEIAENCPRQQRTLAACHRALHSARENPDLLEQLVRTKKLPLMALAAHCGVERKTLERHRKYLVAILLAYTNGFEIIRGHLHKVVPQKKEATVL